MYVVRVFVKHFTNYLILHHISFLWMVFKNIFKWKICMAVNLWELRSDLGWKDAASNTEGISLSSINYLRHLMNNERRFVKESTRKKRIFAWSITYLNEWKHPRRSVLLVLRRLFISLFFSFVSIFLFSLHVFGRHLGILEIFQLIKRFSWISDCAAYDNFFEFFVFNDELELLET